MNRIYINQTNKYFIKVNTYPKLELKPASFQLPTQIFNK